MITLIVFIFIIIIVLASLTVLIFLWRAVQDIQYMLQHTKQPVDHAIDPEDKRRALESLQNLVNKEAQALIRNLEKDVNSVSSQLKDTLLKNASDNMTAQVEQSKQLVAQSATELSLSIKKTASDISAQLTAEVNNQKHMIVEDFEKRMVQVVGAYMVAALGTAAAQTDQATEALKQLEAHKDELRKDLINEA